MPFFFTFLFDYRRAKAKQSAMSKVASLKTIQGANSKYISPRNAQARKIVSDMISDSGKEKVPEAKG